MVTAKKVIKVISDVIKHLHPIRASLFEYTLLNILQVCMSYIQYPFVYHVFNAVAVAWYDDGSDG